MFKEGQGAIEEACTRPQNRWRRFTPALNWIVNDKMFASLRLRGNVGWTAASLVRLTAARYAVPNFLFEIRTAKSFEIAALFWYIATLAYSANSFPHEGENHADEEKSH